MMGTKEKSVQLKVYVDKKKTKVMFAEAEEDFVDILCSFFTLPLGIIARLATKHADSQDIRLGCLTSLYESVVNLNVEHFIHHVYKNELVDPGKKSPSICQNLKVVLEETMSLIDSDAPVFFKNKTSFIITEDLSVVPVKLDTSIVLLKSLGVENINLLEKRTMYFGFEEFLDLLLWSLLSKKPLTNLVLGGSKPFSFFTYSTLPNSAFVSSNSGQTQTVKLVVQKSKKKLLCAQVENPFVELLFSFLTIPLGGFLSLTKDYSSSLGITNLYNSISFLGDGKYLKEEVKTMLLSPKVAPDFPRVNGYPRVTEFLPIYKINYCPGCFLKEPATFIVSNELQVTSPSMDTISNFNTLGVPVDDMEVLEVSIGEKEALLLLKTSLTSTSALTDFLNAFQQETKGSI